MASHLNRKITIYLRSFTNDKMQPGDFHDDCWDSVPAQRMATMAVCSNTTPASNDLLKLDANTGQHYLICEVSPIIVFSRINKPRAMWLTSAKSDARCPGRAFEQLHRRSGEIPVPLTSLSSGTARLSTKTCEAEMRFSPATVPLSMPTRRKTSLSLHVSD